MSYDAKIPTAEERWVNGYIAAYEDLTVPVPDNIVAPHDLDTTGRKPAWMQGYEAGLDSIPKQAEPDDDEGFNAPMNEETLWLRGYATAYEDVKLPMPDLDNIPIPDGLTAENGEPSKIWSDGFDAGKQAIRDSYRDVGDIAMRAINEVKERQDAERRERVAAGLPLPLIGQQLDDFTEGMELLEHATAVIRAMRCLADHDEDFGPLPDGLELTQSLILTAEARMYRVNNV